jgi:hypothetical protein
VLVQTAPHGVCVGGQEVASAGLADVPSALLASSWAGAAARLQPEAGAAPTADTTATAPSTRPTGLRRPATRPPAQCSLSAVPRFDRSLIRNGEEQGRCQEEDWLSG